MRVNQLLIQQRLMDQMSCLLLSSCLRRFSKSLLMEIHIYKLAGINLISLWLLHQFLIMG